VNDFRPGLEGVVAFQTEIAEPDKEGNALRYRGVDIEELVGRVPYERVWGLLVDDCFDPGMPNPEPYRLERHTGRPMGDLQMGTAIFAGEWGLGQLIDITAEQFLVRWRDETNERHVRAIDSYWVSAAEHGLNASTFTARVVASTGADCAAAMSSAVGALSGPLHGGAPTRVLRMLDEVAASGDTERYVKGLLDRGERLMGFGHRVYRAEDPRARLLRRTAKELGSPRFEVAEDLERVALAELKARKPDRVLATNVEFWSAVVLDVAEIPPDLYPAMFACARVAGWSAHIVEEKQTGRLIRPSAQYIGPPSRPASGVRGRAPVPS
jgi:citrate synthase